MFKLRQIKTSESNSKPVLALSMIPAVFCIGIKRGNLFQFLIDKICRLATKLGVSEKKSRKKTNKLTVGFQRKVQKKG